MIYNDSTFNNMAYCTRCCLPETVQGIEFDELGICKACRASEQKMRIDWTQREKSLRDLLEKQKISARASDNYDCIIPISGGKDSAFQLHVLTKVYGLRPLAVTHSHNWFSEAGWWNLWNIIEKMDVDHILYTPKRSLVNRMARKSLCLIGDSCWHCHAGIMSWPLLCAVQHNISLIVFGESPAEFSGRDTFSDQKQKMNEATDVVDIFMKGSVRKGADAMVDDTIEKHELKMYYPPTVDDLKNNKIKSIYLGDYVFWDHERQTEFLVDTYGWKEDTVEGSFKRYKSVECIMPGVHDFSKYIKRGYGRGTDFASQDVRAGLMTREEAMELARTVDSKVPDALEKYLEITGYSEEEFYEILKEQRILPGSKDT